MLGINYILIILILIIGLIGVAIGIGVYIYLKNKKKRKKCPKCGSTNTYLLKMQKFCPTCNRNVGVYRCEDCKFSFLECEHVMLDSQIKK